MQEILLKIISLGTIVLLILLFTYMVLTVCKIKNPVQKIIKNNRIQILFLISLMGTVGSILLSIYFKLAACELCWYQRVFLFSIPVITSIALIKEEARAHIYIYWLSFIGLLIAAYHSLLQSKFFAPDSVFCNPNAVIDCSIPSFTYYGFVTIPVISFTVFLMLVIISYESKKV
jgi:hypothetical protein